MSASVSSLTTTATDYPIHFMYIHRPYFALELHFYLVTFDAQDSRCGEFRKDE